MTNETLDSKVDGAEDQAACKTEETQSGCACPSVEAVDAIIRKRVYGAIGIGFVPVPIVDFLGLSAIQLEMIHALAKAYGQEFKKEKVKSIVSSLCGGLLTTASVPLAASIFKSIPIIGYTAGAASISIMGGASTYALGWVFDRHFRNGGTLVNFDTEEAKVYFKNKVEEGKTFVGKMKNKLKKEPAAQDAPQKEEKSASAV